MTTPRTIPLDDLSEDQLAVLAEFQARIIFDEDPPEDVELATAEVDVKPYARKGDKGIELVKGHERVQEFSPAGFFRDPVERLKGLEGTWDRWTKEKIWTKSAAEIKDDESLNLPKGFEEKSSYSKTFGAVSARWQGDHIDINPKQWDESEPDTRAFLLAHEMSHAAAADILANFDEDQRKAILEPFAKGDSSIQAYDVGHLHTEGRNEWARPPEEMLSDIGAELLIYGSDVLDQRFESNKQYDIGAEPEDDRLQALYAMVAEALKRVGNPPTPGKAELAMGVVDVDPYVRRGEHGFQFVVGHERGHQFDIDQVLRAHFEVPGTPEEAARRDVDLAQRRAAAHLEVLEAMSAEELREHYEGEYGATRAYGRFNPMTKAVFFERFPGEESTDPGYFEWLLKFARNDPGARRRAEEKAVPIWREAMRNWYHHKETDREAVQTRATAVFSERKMAEAAAAFGLPEIFVATHMPYESAIGRAPLDRSADYGNHRITIYADRYGDQSIAENDMRSTGPVHPGQGLYVASNGNLAGTIRHEYGHMVHEQIREAETGRYFSRRPNTYGRGKPDSAAYFIRDSLDRAAKAGKPKPLVVSEYAGTNEREAWAEGFTIVMHPDYDREDWRGVVGEDLLDHVTNILETAGVHV